MCRRCGEGARANLGGFFGVIFWDGEFWGILGNWKCGLTWSGVWNEERIELGGGAEIDHGPRPFLFNCRVRLYLTDCEYASEK
jgi:hypothetical protein